MAAFQIAIAAGFGTSNPNLKAIAEMKKSGVESFVCRQYLAAEKIAPKSLTADVTLAADALLVLIHYQNPGICGAEFLRAYDGSEQSFFQIEKLFR